MGAARRLATWLSQEHWLIGASLVRILLGCWAIYYYTLHYPVRHLLWGPTGLWPYERFMETPHMFFNIWQLSLSPIAFETLYVLGIFVAVAYTIGYWSRMMGVLHWVMIWSLQERNSFIGDGGDNIMRIVLLLLILVNTGAYLSLDALRQNRRERRPHPLKETLRPALAVAHNFGVLLILAQLSMMYISTGLYKVMGELWQNGTALYYILRVDEFSWPGVAEFLYRNPYLVVGGTYGTVFFELLFAPSILLNRWTRYLMIPAGLFFHLGIAAFMGLVTFGWSMLSYYPLLVTDKEYQSVAAWLRERLKLTVFYDGWCQFCRRSIGWLGQFDLFSLVEFVSFRELGVVERYELDAQKAERRMQSIGRNRKISEGMDTMIQIALRSPLLWLLMPLLLLSRLVAGQRAYDAIASRRFVLIPGGCEGHCLLERRDPI